jgi:hypothetical protein
MIGFAVVLLGRRAERKAPAAAGVDGAAVLPVVVIEAQFENWSVLQEEKIRTPA